MTAPDVDAQGILRAQPCGHRRRAVLPHPSTGTARLHALRTPPRGCLSLKHKTCMHAMVDSQPHPAKAQDPVSRHDLRSNSKTGVNGSQRAGSSTKKNGAGGKGTWGKLGDEYKATHVMDKGDPNYDDEAEAAVFEASS